MVSYRLSDHFKEGVAYEISFTQKTKLIKKLADFGISSEKDLKAIKISRFKIFKVKQ